MLLVRPPERVLSYVCVCVWECVGVCVYVCVGMRRDVSTKARRCLVSARVRQHAIDPFIAPHVNSKRRKHTMRGSWYCLNSVRIRQPLSYASVMRSFLFCVGGDGGR
jgi:hypothetical protein